MNKNNWITKEKDLHIARTIMEAYAVTNDSEVLGLFELVVDTAAKSMDFRLSEWVVALATKFHTMYGADQGELVTRLVITSCMTEGQILH